MTAQGPTAPIVRDHTLERIARFLGDHGSGPQIVEWLRSWGVADHLIVYPNTKWRMVYDVLLHYSHSTDKKDHELLYKVIAEMLHPLMFNGDKAVAQAAAADFNKFLEYDGVVATYSNDAKRYYVYKEDEQDVSAEEVGQLLNEEFFRREYDELEFLRRPENKELISTLRKTYQIFMNVVEVFCEDPSHPTGELNHAYTECKDLITRAVMNLDIYDDKKVNRLYTYSLPFLSLFNAEKYYKQNGQVLSWDAIRPEMYATYGDIEEIYRKANGSEVLSEPDVQQTLNEVSLLLSKTKEENTRRAKEAQEVAVQPAPVQRIEITAMPVIETRNADERSISQGKKRVYPPKFTATDWSNVSIRFFDERSVFITAGKKQVQSDYEALGFADGKRDKPNTAWAFLLTLAQNNGETNELATPLPDTVKQQKRQLADRLKTIFKNDSDPFDDPTDTRTYKLKIGLVPPPVDGVQHDALGVEEYLKETMTEE